MDIRAIGWSGILQITAFAGAPFYSLGPGLGKRGRRAFSGRMAWFGAVPGQPCERACFLRRANGERSAPSSPPAATATGNSPAAPPSPVVNGERPGIVEDGVDQRSQHDLKAEGDGARLRRLAARAHDRSRMGVALRHVGARQCLEGGPPVRPRVVVLKGGAQHAFVVSDPADGPADEEAAELGEIGLGQPLSSFIRDSRLSPSRAASAISALK
jgi:hypothetical protein